MKSLFDLRNLISAYPGSPGALLGEDESASGVLAPFIRLHGEYHLVFEKRARHIRQPGEIGFPGGRFDPVSDSTTRDTARRETVEELGVPPASVTVYRRIGTLVAGSATAVDVYPGVLRIRSLESLRPAPSEVDFVFAVPFSYFVRTDPSRYSVRTEMHSYRVDENGNEVVTFPAKDLGLPAQYHRSWTGRSHELLVYSWQGQQIWGMTARVVRSLVEVYRRIGRS
ncbi:MAG TPA: CoA pyrophosphatase [Spirochaetia bacterium]|nr:CoA pyrophosphatase [Spirochaetia bacterium]